MSGKTLKFKSTDVNEIYKHAFDYEIPWKEIVGEDMFKFLSLHERATFCANNLTMSNVLACISSLCGPKTSIETKDKCIKSSINMFVISVCDPGGGMYD